MRGKKDFRFLYPYITGYPISSALLQYPSECFGVFRRSNLDFICLHAMANCAPTAHRCLTHLFSSTPVAFKRMASRKRAFLLILPPSHPSIAIPNIAEHYLIRHVLAMSLRHSASFGLALAATMAPLNDLPKTFLLEGVVIRRQWSVP